MEKYLITYIIAALPYFLWAQQNAKSDSEELNNYNFQQITGEKYNDPGSRHLNIYFKEDWISGTIVLTTGAQIKDLVLKYNGFTNQLIMLTDKYGQIKVDNQTVSEFDLIDQTQPFITQPFKTQPNQTQTYHFKKIKLDTLNFAPDIFYQVLFQDKTELYVYRRIKDNATNYRDDGEYHIYVPRPIYILFINNKKIIIYQASRKEIYNKFPELKEQIKQKTHQYNKKIRTEEEFIRFLKEIEDILLESDN